MSQILGEVVEQAVVINDTMSDMSKGMGDVSATVGESVRAVTSVAEDAALLADAINSIQAEKENTNKISEELQNQVRRFEKV